ncbi:hypothetical protein HID58_057763 [Brassica napus]|uniref:Uncharacterized protein n=1 Tax=Brassica napus TaxID=3708 RepID=A0ABQ7XFG2_BRANA|nr:hypothetical protein HID58_057763 [Brassica napus]
MGRIREKDEAPEGGGFKREAARRARPIRIPSSSKRRRNGGKSVLTTTKTSSLLTPTPKERALNGEDRKEFDEAAEEEEDDVQEPLSSDEFSIIVKHRKSVVSVALSDDDIRGFSASKDGTMSIGMYLLARVTNTNGQAMTFSRSLGVKKHSRESLALAVSSDGRYLATVELIACSYMGRSYQRTCPGHRNTVSCLCFRHGTAELYSGSFDRSVKRGIQFGHQDEILAIDALRKERALTVGKIGPCYYTRCLRDEPQRNCCALGHVEKKPVFLLKNAHSVVADGTTTNENGDHDYVNSSTTNSWVSSVAVCRGSDLAASGAGNGFVHLMATGFVNSMAFAKSGKFLIAGVGQETRFGRWGCIKSAQNGVAIHPLRLS